MEYYSAIKKDKIELFVVRWMDLESVIQNEVSQKEKNNYCMLTHIYGIYKKEKKVVLKNLGQDSNKDADIQNGLEDTGRRKGKLGRSERMALTYMHYQM